MIPFPPRLLLALLLNAGSVGAVSAQGATLGRLFHSPAERAAIDDRRGGPAAAPSLSAPATTPATFGTQDAVAPAGDAAPTQLNGVVKSSSGRTTVWLNQAPLTDHADDILNNQSQSFKLSSGRKLLLKPGQVFNPTDGSVRDVERH
jgi:hypothetical protein